MVSGLLLVTDGLSLAAGAAGFVPARVGAAIGMAAVPAFLTPLSATLVHGGFMHLLFNIIMLVWCGRQAERAVGSIGLGVLYVVGAYAAAAGQWAADPQATVPMIGASGAISAVVGAYALLFGRLQARAFGPVPARAMQAVWLSAGWIGIQLLIGATEPVGQPIAIAAHIGGFLAGLVLARPLLLWRWRGA